MFGSRTYYRKTLILLAIGLSICGAYSWLDRLKWVDSLFLIGLLFLIIAGAATVWRGGFFRVLFIGFRRQFGRWDENFDAPEDSTPSPGENFRPWIIPAFFTAGLFLITFSILLLFL